MSRQDIKKEEFKKKIGFRLKEFRLALKKTQVELAGELGFHKAFISEIERGKMFPGLFFLYNLYRQYNLNINFLFKEGEEMFLFPGKNSKDPDLSILFWHLGEYETGIEQYVELISLMRMPFIEKVIFAKLAEVKSFAAVEIRAFFEGS